MDRDHSGATDNRLGRGDDDYLGLRTDYHSTTYRMDLYETRPQLWLRTAHTRAIIHRHRCTNDTILQSVVLFSNRLGLDPATSRGVGELSAPRPPAVAGLQTTVAVNVAGWAASAAGGRCSVTSMSRPDAAMPPGGGPCNVAAPR